MIFSVIVWFSLLVLSSCSDFDKSEMSSQLDNLQAELDHVRDVFTSGGTYNFDANTLFEVRQLEHLSFYHTVL